MPSWSEVAFEAPDLARRARGYFDRHTHKFLATVRRDGSPRISGIETTFADGELWLGMMRRSVKALDLIRDPRFALHSGSDEPPEWRGDAKVAGLAEEVTDERRAAVAAGDAPAHVFRCEITELVVVSLNETLNGLVIESWHPDRGLERRERS